MEIKVKESDRLKFESKMVSEMENQNATVEFTSKRYNKFEFNGITVFDVRKIRFTDYEVVVECKTKGNVSEHQVFFPLGFLREIDCKGVYWSEMD